MYLRYPAPDDEELARSLEPLQAHLREAMAACPERFRLKKRRAGQSLPPRRHVYDDPLRLAVRTPARRRSGAAAAIPEAARRTDPGTILREALDAGRQRGLTFEMIAERAGYSERTLRRHLQKAAEMPLGEYCRILAAAQPEGGA